MKTSSAPGNRKPPTALELAQACMTSNVAIPGLGTIIGGQKIGYAQIAICLTGMGMSLIFGLRVILFTISHWNQVFDNQNLDDPFASWNLIWPGMRWALLGILLFAIAWLWAMQTSLEMVRKAKRNQPPHENQPAQ